MAMSSMWNHGPNYIWESNNGGGYPTQATDFQIRAHKELCLRGCYVQVRQLPDAPMAGITWRLTLTIERADGSEDEVAIDTEVGEDFPDECFLAKIALVCPNSGFALAPKTYIGA